MDSDFTSLPRLRFEYVPGGTLRNYTDLSTGECLQILCQCLSALVYLHGHKPPIVHRDIKPSNILVRHRHANNIYVKLGDFGLAREGADPTTICGSPPYLAPEIYRELDRREAQYGIRSYTPAVDIWSLGVSVLECAYDLPSYRAGGFRWCAEIVTKLARDLERDPDDLKQFLFDAMVIIEPKLREPARYCYDEVLLLADRAQDRSITPTPASHDPVEDQQTILLQDTYRATATSQRPSLDDLTEIRRDVRSNGPPPESIIPPRTRERTKDSLSSSERYTKRHAVSSQPPPSKARQESEVWDVLHPLGGRSSLAAFIGQEVSDLNTSTIRTSTPRSVQDPVDDGPNGAQPSEVYLPQPDRYLAGGDAFVLAGAQVVAAPTDSERELAAKLLVEISHGRN
ncbi:hypothetical protein VTK26DRAFT_9220 [Humicola hyalothermophila]